MKKIQESGAGMLDEKSIRTLVSSALDQPEEWGASRLGVVIIQRRSVIESLLGSSLAARGRNLIWIWRCQPESSHADADGSLSKKLVGAAIRQGLHAVSVSIPTKVLDRQRDPELPFPGGFLPGEAVLLGYPADDSFRPVIRRSPELLLWMK